MKKSRFILYILLPLLCAPVLLAGCSDMVLFNPKGPIGEAERSIIYIAIALMLIVVIPVFVMTIWFPWKYRASNTKATYRPKWSYSGKIDFFVWLIPLIIIAALAILVWVETHRLNPYKPISSNVEPVNIQAVSLDWKWLFIYPDQNIASVNELVFPAKTPLSFRITSDTVMTSFFIPQLGSQIYAMAGMQTRLHLMADEPGVYRGQNQQFSGRGFSRMQFKAVAVSQKGFQEWVNKAKKSKDKLDLARYEKIEKPSMGYPVTYFSSVVSKLFDHIITQYNPMFLRPSPPNEKYGSVQGRNDRREES
ncbi:MAG: ubiquinol oxidase subunit II [Deltaproteobacteria bacterium]|nr:ubiquinol oxidase subunit II [Deltaproteobacteria bacterium]